MRSAAALLAVCLLFCACTTVPKPKENTGWTRVPNRYAKHFVVLRQGADRWVCVFSDTAQHDTLGSYRFSAEERSERSAEHLPQALHRIVLGSTTHVPFVAALGGLDAVVGCTHLADVHDTDALRRMTASGVKEVITGNGLDREVVVALHPEAVLGYPFGRQSNVEHLGMPVIEVAEYLEEHPLGKAEWLRFFGVLLGREHAADSVFDAIAARYEAMRGRTVAGSQAPMVFFGSSWEKQWFVPPGNSYMAQLIADAGGHYVFAETKGHGNITLDAEAAVGEGAKADVWGTVLAQDRAVSETDIAGGDPRLLGLPAFQQHRTFYGNSTESDLFGDAALEPDVMLADLRAILHPGGSGREGVYFRAPAQNGMPSRR